MFPKNRPMTLKSGYKMFLTSSMREKYLQARKSFEDFNLSDELTLLRMVLGQVMGSLEESGEGLRVGDVAKIVREIRETMKLMAVWMEKATIPIASLHVAQQQMIQVLREEIKDDEQLRRISSKLGQVHLPRDSRELDRLNSAIRSGKVLESDA